MPIDASIQRKVASMSDEMAKLRQQHKDNISAQSDQVANKLDMLKNKKQQILDAEKKRAKATNQSANKDSATASRSEQVDVTLAVEAMLNEKAAVGGFNYEKEINDKLKKMGKADKDSTTAGSSADAPDAKFTHNGKEHHLEVKQNSKAMFGQIELHHDGKKWDISERSKKKYPATHAAIAATGFLKKINKQWDKPTGDYDTDLQLGNVYHTHHDAEPIKAHYGTDRKTNYIQIGGGHGFYHTGNDAARLGSPELEGKATLRARMKYRGTDRKTGKKKYGALIVMGLKDAEKSHHNLDESIQKKWILDTLRGHELFESVLNPKDPHKDYEAKRKALHDLSLNKDVDQKAVQQRRLDLDKEYSKYQKESLNELSSDLLGRYKKAASTQASDADKAGNYEKGNKRFKGINKATIKQFDNDLKKHDTIKEDMLQLRKMLDKHTEKALAANKQGDDEKVKHHQRMMNKVKDQMSKLVKENLNEEGIPFVDAFWSGQQEEPKQNPYAADTVEYTEYENGYMQGVMTRRRMQTEAWSETGKEGTHRETGEKTKEYQEVDDEGKPTGKRQWRNAKGQNMGESLVFEEVPNPSKKRWHQEPMRPTAPAPYIHRVAVTVSEPDHPAVTKRDEKKQKFIRVSDHREDKSVAVERAKKHYAKKGYKVHSAEHVGMVHEEVAANNVGGGAIAGTQGDAGKKIVMTKEPLKRKPLPKFKTYVSQEHDGY
jgi:hypothetical protein